MITRAHTCLRQAQERLNIQYVRMGFTRFYLGIGSYYGFTHKQAWKAYSRLVRVEGTVLHGTAVVWFVRQAWEG